MAVGMLPENCRKSVVDLHLAGGQVRRRSEIAQPNRYETMAEDAVYITDRADKLRFLRESDLAKEIADHSGSEESFADAIGCARSTVNGWINETTHRRSIPTIVNNNIADRFKFPAANWEPWLKKSAGVFKADYEKLAGQLKNEPTSSSRSRNTDLPLKQGPDPGMVRGPIRGLASIELTCGNTGRGDTVIGVNIACGDAFISVSPYPITVRAGELEIDCGHARATEDSVKGAAQETFGRFDATGSAGMVRCKWSGDFKRLRWILDATGASIGTLIFEPGVLAKIVGLAPGDVIKGTFGTYLKDIESDESAPAKVLDQFTVVDRLGERPELAGEQLSVLYNRIIEHLRKSVLTTDEGFAVISSHELHFVERSDR